MFHITQHNPVLLTREQWILQNADVIKYRRHRNRKLCAVTKWVDNVNKIHFVIGDSSVDFNQFNVESHSRSKSRQCEEFKYKPLLRTNKKTGEAGNQSKHRATCTQPSSIDQGEQRLLVETAQLDVEQNCEFQPKAYHTQT